MKDILANPDRFQKSLIDCYKDLDEQGYIYEYSIDDTRELIISKSDIGDEGNEIIIIITLNAKKLGGRNFWLWEAHSKQKPSDYYLPGANLILVGSLVTVIGIGAWKFSPVQFIEKDIWR